MQPSREAASLSVGSGPAARAKDASSTTGYHRGDLCFFVLSATDQPFNSELLAAWAHLLQLADSPETVFQTPGYFDFISSLPNVENVQELVVVRQVSSQRIVAVVPVRAGRRTLSLRLGERVLARIRIRTVALLGSIPLAPVDDTSLDAIFDFLIERQAGTSSIAMQAVPAGSDFHRYLLRSAAQRKSHGLYVQDGWRHCHATALPLAYADYLSGLKAKKRYNLNRQVKTLAKEAGPVELVRVDRSEQIPMLLAAVAHLSMPADIRSIMNAQRHERLAMQKLALCYVLKCGDTPVAAIIGLRSGHTYHVHNIIYAPALASHSPGASIVHLAIEDLIDNLQIRLMDYGYGTPGHGNPSGDAGSLRGNVFLYRKTLRNRWLFSCYTAFNGVVRWMKALREGQDTRAPRSR
ncbi:MAG: family N-acetyltransferase [Rhodoferax sp.]|nr:family N-acetyltransferase [Rhodoferax sp.]